ncbi:MAG: Ribosomal RNA large subunit methyltransferase N [Candidatus Wolfebacteria bacterium GW2011_GWE1_48_7]|uniref:Probable dual-specificity RNA methyltransferase RlmN n=2 Tax=Candidatus Wolfeibacteriota TaxID=1752735 RepID=A0A0G1U6Q7_9BACT|nr:MAG: ribosomal RNA large subunit methyltransferase N 2, 23S rRNA (adenine2503-C2)-methyltransferase [Candidatus Wolfebacteria bacterium GW2011_GWB1_47_1]KKU36941.1 MAG: Ribosomal RNA large subunit methyltransferase N [Candidatus Wolfebacteria bacterium GW2011_GWC2_46_275]KKU42216.1 MAG: Ribosomal RNA large subunit methyltransferase N [Candidatus Wolfebacteria bacterium GW2011_GWB2_46_69]KKU53837.1 MAG: Ribosomal RNA large subunit methyltransferase N [Candidatus Wolfebacteria bacterium GW2011_
MNISALKEILTGQPNYRQQQVEKALYGDQIEDWSQVIALPEELRRRLAEACPLEIRADDTISGGDSRKALIVLEDGLKIEAVLMMHQGDRNTVCVSSQVGCPMKCAFCATGRLGLKRSLTADEIVEQVLYFARQLKKEHKRVTNVVFMGMGEPMINYDNVMTAIRTLNNPKGFNLGARRISVSTSGIPDGIRKFAREGLEVNLALSLHAPNNELRCKIMPVSTHHSLESVMEALAEYVQLTNRKIMFEYIMIKGVTDGPEQAHELVKLLSGWLGYVNLINYNQTDVFESSTRERIEAFKKILEDGHITVVQRYTFGEDIDGACGQLAARKEIKLD